MRSLACVVPSDSQREETEQRGRQAGSAGAPGRDKQSLQGVEGQALGGQGARLAAQPLAAAPAQPSCSPLLSHRQLDNNHISCIEDGAFRALRDLEIL